MHFWGRLDLQFSTFPLLILFPFCNNFYFIFSYPPWFFTFFLLLFPLRTLWCHKKFQFCTIGASEVPVIPWKGPIVYYWGLWGPCDNIKSSHVYYWGLWGLCHTKKSSPCVLLGPLRTLWYQKNSPYVLLGPLRTLWYHKKFPMCTIGASEDPVIPWNTSVNIMTNIFGVIFLPGILCILWSGVQRIYQYRERFSRLANNIFN